MEKIPTPSFSIPYEFVQVLSMMPRDGTKCIRFVDYDGTLFPDTRRFEIDKKLIELRGDSAYPYIQKAYADPERPFDIYRAYQRFAEKLDPKNHLFCNIRDFYNDKDPQHVILTAGDTFLQNAKIEYSGFDHFAPRILVENAQEKPHAMLKYIIENFDYIPGKIEFYDDRIENFAGWDYFLEDLLGVEVVFYKVKGSESDQEKPASIQQVTHQRYAYLLS